MQEPTISFSIHEDKDRQMKEVLMQVYDALRQKGYNPINQIVGYILSEDPTYITTHNNARSLIRRIDRDDLLRVLVKSYLDNQEKRYNKTAADDSAAFCVEKGKHGVRQVQLGNTNIQVSTMCFGTLTVGPLQAGLPLEDGALVLAQGIRQGVNFFDTAQLYETYPYIRRAMEITGSYNVVVSTKTYAYTRQQAAEAVEQARRELNRDYVDIFMLHEQESIHTLRGHMPALEYLLECKQKGIIKAVGASMHHIAAVEGAVELGLDCIHPLINLTGLGIVDGGRGAMESSIKKAFDKGIGVFSMKPLGGGNLFRRAEECLQYILGLDCLHSVAIGMQSPEEVDANVAFWQSGGFTAGQKALLEDKRRRLHLEDWCEGCGACVQRCGQKALHMEASRAVCNHKECVLCGYCSTVCPAWAIKIV